MFFLIDYNYCTLRNINFPKQQRKLNKMDDDVVSETEDSLLSNNYINRNVFNIEQFVINKKFLFQLISYHCILYHKVPLSSPM